MNCDLIDTWRQIHPLKRDFTWTRPSPFVARRLDYIFCSHDLSSRVTESKHEFCVGTDHKAVISYFQTDDFRYGKSYWKFNDSLLHDTSFVNIMNGVIDDFILHFNDFDDATERWEFLKNTIKRTFNNI